MVISRRNTSEPPQNDPIFVVDGEPVMFYLMGTNEENVSSALTADQRKVLTAKIKDHGGKICQHEHDAHTVIVRERALQRYRSNYEFLPDRYAEPPMFVEACIRNRRYKHEKVVQRPMGGRIPGSTRTEFTRADDEHLCRFIATVLPYRSMGGRTGNNVWKKLMLDAQSVPELKWAQRHTWESWRERYKKRQEHFDPIIDAYAMDDPPPDDGKGLYPYNRQMNKIGPSAFQRAQMQQRYEEEEEEEEEEELGEFTPTFDDEDPTAIKKSMYAYTGHPDDSLRVAHRNSHPQRRRTDIGPRRDAPAVQQPRRNRTLSATHNAMPRSPSVGDFEQPDEYHDFDLPPGPSEAGPSGTQHTPSAEPEPVKTRVLPRPVRAAIPTRLTQSQIPMSSQATLVGRVPTQLRNVPPSQQRQNQSQAGPGGRPAGRRAASRANAVDVTDGGDAQDESEQEDEFEDEDELEDGEDEDELDEEDEDHEEEERWEDEAGSEEDMAYSHTVGQTNEEEQDVENILDQSIDHEANPGSPHEEEESDDERARKKLFKPSTSNNLRKRPVDVEVDEDEDEDEDERFAENLDFTRPPVRRSSGMSAPQLTSSHVASPGPAHAPSTPRAQRISHLSRAEIDASTRSSPSASSVSAVPLPNTRASAEKNKRRRVVTPFEPLLGTRAAQMVGQSSQAPAPAASPKPKSKPEPKKVVKQLRNRTVRV